MNLTCVREKVKGKKKQKSEIKRPNSDDQDYTDNQTVHDTHSPGKQNADNDDLGRDKKYSEEVCIHQ